MLWKVIPKVIFKCYNTMEVLMYQLKSDYLVVMQYNFLIPVVIVFQ